MAQEFDAALYLPAVTPETKNSVVCVPTSKKSLTCDWNSVNGNPTMFCTCLRVFKLPKSLKDFVK